MGSKEMGLLYGSVVFAVLGLIVGIILSMYVDKRTKDRAENGKY